MAFNWKAIRGCESTEESFYRLIGEMLHRTASARDLIELRDFLLRYNPGPDAWTSLGEGLHCTTNGSDTGFRLWTAWSRSLRGPDFDLLEHARRWRTFGAGATLEEETATDDAERPAELFDTDEDELEIVADTATNTATDVFHVQRRTPENRGRGTRTGDLVRQRAPVDASTTALRALIPGDEPRAVKLFGRVFEAVTPEEFVSLLRRGVLPAAELEYDGTFISILLHPDFGPLAEALRDEAFRVFDDSGASGPSKQRRRPPKP